MYMHMHMHLQKGFSEHPPINNPCYSPSSKSHSYTLCSMEFHTLYQVQFLLPEYHDNSRQMDSNLHLQLIKLAQGSSVGWERIMCTYMYMYMHTYMHVYSTFRM